MKSYHKFVIEASTSSVSQLAPPPEVAINKNNITQIEKAILDVYVNHTPGSLFDQIKKSPYWGLMHDGITKFTTEFNGVYLRGINPESEPFSVPYCLTKMNGGVNGFDLGNYLFPLLIILCFNFLYSFAKTFCTI